MTIVFAAVALVAVAGLALAVRHVALRLARPGGFECSLRVVTGDVRGLGARFRSGYAGPELDGFVWHRLIWPSGAVRFPATAVRLDEEHAPSRRDLVVSVPAHFAVVPVVLPDGVRIDLALPRRRIDRVIRRLG